MVGTAKTQARICVTSVMTGPQTKRFLPDWSPKEEKLRDRQRSQIIKIAASLARLRHIDLETIEDSDMKPVVRSR